DARDVDAGDSPVGRQPLEIGPVADRHVEQLEVLLLRQMAENHISRPLLTAIADEEEPLPEPELGPERAVVEVASDAVIFGRIVLDDQDAVLDRKVRATVVAAEPAFRGSEAAVACDATEEIRVRGPVDGRVWSCD